MFYVNICDINIWCTFKGKMKIQINIIAPQSTPLPFLTPCQTPSTLKSPWVFQNSAEIAMLSTQ